MTDTLTLRIENQATLDNGGPVSITLSGKGAQVGRKAGNDWVLPDPSRHISGHHFDVSFEGGRYVLVDVSSNGTFLHGERYRLSGPHEINDGDRFTVGHYILRAEIQAGMAQAADPAPAPSADDEFDDVWGDLGGGADSKGVQAPPGAGILRPASVPPVQMPGNGQGASGGGSGIAAPPTTQGPGTGVSMPPSFGQAGSTAPSATHAPPAPPASHAAPPAPAGPAASAQATAPQVPPPQEVPPQAFAPPPEPATGRGLGESFSEAGPAPGLAAQPAYPAGGGDAQGDALMRGFLQGAGIADPSRMQIPPEELGRILGQIARIGTNELMRMLQDRAAVKLFVSNEDRTMRVATGNNPMKFMVDSEQAFEALFLQPRDGYLTGSDGFENALGDIRRHQAAVIAAVQPALAEMLDGLSPADIEEDTGGGMLGGGSRKAWEEFSKRWETRAAQGENGMLDAFIKAFSRHYGEALRKL